MAIVLLTVAMLAVVPPSLAATFSANVRVNTWDLTQPVWQVNPAMAVDVTGLVRIVWQDYRAGSGDPDIWYAESRDDGESYGLDEKISDAPTVPYGPSDQLFPSITSSPSPSGAVAHVVWTDLRPDPGPGIYYTYEVTQNGGGFAPSVRISEGSASLDDWNTWGEWVQAQIAYDGSGGGCHLHVVWSLGSSELASPAYDFDIWYTRSDDCGATWGVPSQVAWTPDPDPLPFRDGHDAALAAHSSGSVGMVFTGFKVYAVGNVPEVYYTWTYRPMFPWNWVVPQRVNDVTGLQGARNPSLTFGQAPVMEPHIAWEDSRNMVAGLYEHDWDIYYTNRPGDVSTADVLVNDKTDGISRRGEQSEPSIGLDRNLNPRIAWTDWRWDADGYRLNAPHEADIYYEESFDHGLNFLAPNIRVNSDPSGRENSRPVVASFGWEGAKSFCGGGAYVYSAEYVVWQDERDLPGDYNVYANSVHPVFLRTTDVDIAGVGAGNDHRIAVASESTVSLFSRATGGPPLRTESMGFYVERVRLSSDGAYLGVVGREWPVTDASTTRVRLYGPIVIATDPWPLFYSESIAGPSRTWKRTAMDMTRDGRFLAVAPDSPTGPLTVFERPPAPGPAPSSAYPWPDAFTVQFSPDGGYLVIGSVSGHLLGSPVSLGLFQVGPGGGGPPVLSNIWTKASGMDAAGATLDSGATRVAEGRRDLKVVLYTGGGATTWEHTGPSIVSQLRMTANGQYLAGGAVVQHNYPPPPATFSLWATSNSTPLWTYSPGPIGWRILDTMDVAVDANAQFMTGGYFGHLYFWGNATAPAPGPLPRTDRTLDNGACVTGLAMTYNGRYTAVIDDIGTVHAYTSTNTADIRLWSWVL